MFPHLTFMIPWLGVFVIFPPYVCYGCPLKWFGTTGSATWSNGTTTYSPMQNSELLKLQWVEIIFKQCFKKMSFLSNPPKLIWRKLIQEHKSTYSKVSIIRPGHSRLLEFEKEINSTGRLIETFSKNQDFGTFCGPVIIFVGYVDACPKVQLVILTHERRNSIIKALYMINKKCSDIALTVQKSNLSQNEILAILWYQVALLLERRPTITEGNSDLLNI